MATRSQGRGGAPGRGRKTRRDDTDPTQEATRRRDDQPPDRTPRPTAPEEVSGAAPAEEWPPRVANYADDGETVLDPRGVCHDDLGDLSPPLQSVESDTGERALENLPDPWSDEPPKKEPPIELTTDVTPGPMIGAATVADPIIDPIIDPLPDSAMIKGSIETRSNDAHPLDPSPHDRPVAVDEDLLPIEDRTLPDISRTRTVEPRAKRTSRPKVLLLAAGATVVLLGIFLVAGLMLSKRAANPSARNGTGSILVRTEPAAACTVFINGRPTELLAPGNSMLLGDLAAKAYAISVRCVGYQPFDRTRTVKPDEVTLLNATLISEPSESSQTP